MLWRRLCQMRASNSGSPEIYRSPLVSRDGKEYLRTILENDEVRNGAILGNVGIPLGMVESSRPEVQIHGQAAGFMAFKDLVSKWDDAVGVAESLGEIRDFIADRVVPSLESFIH